jgi:hypothetical protein
MVIIASKPGQLGNSLFLFANFIAFGIEQGVSIANPAFDQYASYFQGSAGSIISSYPSQTSITRPSFASSFAFHAAYYAARLIQRFRINNRVFACLYLDWHENFNLDSQAALRIRETKYMFVQGWLFRADSYFHKYRKEIIDYFTPVESYQNNIMRFMQPLKDQYDLIIGVHIRHGDYRNFEGGRYYYTLEQYWEVMRNTASLFPNQHICFLICSNAKHNLAKHEELRYVLGPGHPLEDMYCLAQCHYIIGPPSTYSMWASYYGQAKLYMIKEPSSTISLDSFSII